MNTFTDEELRGLLSGALGQFWEGRAVSKGRNAGRETRERGNRGATTAGHNMDGFAEVIEKLVERMGNSRLSVRRKKADCRLPGFFRATKEWDVLVFHGETLLAAIELKSQVGSIGNNANNRMEEGIGSAYDFHKAYGERLLGSGARPFLGWFMLIGESDKTRRPVKEQGACFSVDGVFAGQTYAERYATYCSRLVSAGLYDAASLIVAPVNTCSYSTPDANAGPGVFLRRLAEHLERAAAGSPCA